MTEDHPSLEVLRSQRKVLARLSCSDTPPPLSAPERGEIQQILQCFDQLAEYETLGVCANALVSAKSAMEAYLRAFGVTVTLDIPPRDGSIYLKFNTLNGQWYLDDYSGRSRGMLVSFHGSEPEAINGTYGPFPLDLFD